MYSIKVSVSSPTPLLHAVLTALLTLPLWPATVPAQREYTTVSGPTVTRARARTDNEKVVVRTVTRQPTEGVLVVVLDPIISGEVVVLSAAGEELARAEADEDGQAEFTLKRGQAYQVRASAPGYTSATGRSARLAASATVRLQLAAQFAALRLTGLPHEARVFIDDQLRATADDTGNLTIADIAPGKRKLTIRHADYDEFSSELGTVAAGDQLSYPRLPLVRVARLTVESLPGALVMIDGALKGKVAEDGRVQIKYELDQAAEHTISVALLGYQEWSRRELITPGARKFEAKLEPVITSAGISDAFDDLSLWNAPAAWKVVPVRMPNGRDNRKLQISGEQTGVPKGTVYRDFDALFEVRLADGKGATWAIKVHNTGDNYYLFHLAGPQADVPKKFYTWLVRDGQMTQVSTPIPVIADLKEKDSYTIEVQVRGYRIQHWITSNSSGERLDLGIYTDISNTKDNFLYGNFGFRSLKGETFIVDEFTLQPRSENQKVGQN